MEIPSSVTLTGVCSHRRITGPRWTRRRLLITFALIPIVTGCTLLEAILGLLGGGGPPPTIQVGLELVADGLVAPVGLVAPPDGSNRLVVIDQIGKIRVIDASGNLLEKPFLDLADRMVAINTSFDERGLLGLAFHPDYANNGRLFVFYTAPKQGDIPAEFDSETHISEFAVLPGDANCADSTSERIVLRFGKPQANHNGGQLAFGPDGFLYIGVGDGGAANDEGTGHNLTIGNGQDKNSLLGKILRIDVNGALPYQSPPSNPFVADPAARDEIFAWGLRNPYRFSFESTGQNRLFAADVGQALFEEVNIVTLGGNYGWRIREGFSCFDDDNPVVSPQNCDTNAADGTPLTAPILQYPHSEPAGGPQGSAVIGGFVYHGNTLPLVGQYIFGDYSKGPLFADGSLFAAEESAQGTWTMREVGVRDRPDLRFGRFILGFGQDAAGELYLLSSANLGPTGETGQVHRIIP